MNSRKKANQFKYLIQLFIIQKNEQPVKQIVSIKKKILIINEGMKLI